MRLTIKNIESQRVTAAPNSLVHWAGAPIGACLRKDSNVDVSTAQCNETTITYSAVASWYGNITCLCCRKIAWARGVR